MRVLQGKSLDVAVDVRKGSPTFGKYLAVELSDENKRQSIRHWCQALQECLQQLNN